MRKVKAPLQSLEKEFAQASDSATSDPNVLALQAAKDCTVGRISVTQMRNKLEEIFAQPRTGVVITPRKSIVDLAKMDQKVFLKDSLLGNRLLCCGQGMLMIGPTGIGKSSGGLQQDIYWSCGRDAFGIRPARVLKILHMQSENDEGDLAEMAHGIMKQLILTEHELEVVRQNFIRYDVRALTGQEFTNFLRVKVHEHRPDLVRIDPLEAFVDGDLRDADIAARFLRVWIDKILVDYRCAIIINHHTTKTIYRDTSQWTPTDWAYAGAGGAVIANWPRAIMAIEATSMRVAFKFHIAKRWTRSGWANDNGEPTNERVFCWQGGGNIFWRDATRDEVEALQRTKAGHPVRTKEDLKAMVPPVDPILKNVLLEKRPEGMGRDRARALLDELIEDGELFEHPLKRKNTNRQIWVSRHKDFAEPKQESLPLTPPSKPASLISIVQ